MEEVVAIMMVFSIPLVAIFLAHTRKMAEMRGLGGANSPQVSEQLKQMSAQIAELRDTTTRYDMSFDTALQRLESRMGAIEGKVQQIEAKKAETNTQQISV